MVLIAVKRESHDAHKIFEGGRCSWSKDAFYECAPIRGDVQAIWFNNSSASSPDPLHTIKTTILH